MIEIAGALAAFKGAKDLLSVMYDAKIDTDVKGKVSEVLGKLGQVQDTLYELRDELFRLQSENEAMKRTAATSEEWKKKAALYELVKTIGGAVVYKSKGSPEHYACPNCFNKKDIVPLQPNRTTTGKYRCTAAACNGAEFPIEPAHKLPMVRSNAGGGWMGT